MCDWLLRKGWISLPVKAEASCWRRQKKSGKPSLEIYTFLLMKSMEWEKGISGLRTAQRSPASLWSPALFEDMARMWFLPVSEKRSKKGGYSSSLPKKNAPLCFLGESRANGPGWHASTSSAACAFPEEWAAGASCAACAAGESGGAAYHGAGVPRGRRPRLLISFQRRG